MELTDSHIHLADFPDPEAIVHEARAREMLLVSVSTDLESARVTIHLRARYPGHVRAFAGIHPSQAGPETKPEELESIWNLADGIGEIGLDPKYSSVCDDAPQARAFLKQLEAAEKLSKPVQVHSRGSARLCLDHLSKFDIRGVLMHWFDDEACLEAVTSRGYYVSFGPALLYSKKLRRIAALHPLGLTLAESDGPVPYAGLGGDVRGSFLVPSVLFTLAEIRGERVEEVEAKILANTLRFLSVK